MTPTVSDPDDTLADFNRYRGELAERMGITIIEATPERLVATMPVEGNRQPYGLLHGGASVALAETAGSMAAMLSPGARGRAAVGIEINATHHRAATAGLVTAVCVPVATGRTLATYDIRITDADGRPVCTARLTCLLRERPPAGADAAAFPGPAAERGPETVGG
jgi:1,4-dihydroxy-2-naphthoyl-CoA hydrolase